MLGKQREGGEQEGGNVRPEAKNLEINRGGGVAKKTG